MPHWLLKCAVQRAIGTLPGRQKWNGLFQRYVTRTLELNTARFEGRLGFCRRHLDYFLCARPEATQGFSAVELGTGWYPVVPLGLYLCGARQVHTFDIDDLLQGQRMAHLLRLLVDYHNRGALAPLLPRIMPDRAESLRELARQAEATPPSTLLRKVNIYPVIGDARNSGLPGGSVDLITSTGVLEYIPRGILKGILAEFIRIGRPDALHVHYLNLVDQYSDFDRSLTPFNYLKYSSQAWRWLNSPLTWQSRLRISDYRALFAEAGYIIRTEESLPGEEEDLAKVRLAPEFQHYSRDDLLVLYSWIVAEANR